jgi:hypothetical protein
MGVNQLINRLKTTIYSHLYFEQNEWDPLPTNMMPITIAKPTFDQQDISI